MALNTGIGTRDAFRELKKLTPQKRVDYINTMGSGASSFLTALTPAEFAELFPKYYQRGLPDIGGFREAVSVQSRQRQEGINRKVLGEGSGGTTVADQSISNRVMARDIYNYLRNTHNVDHVHAMGILASIQGESRFNSGVVNQNDRGGPSGGLFQFHDVGFNGRGRFSQMKAFVGEDWKTNWKKQIDYAMTESEMKLYLSHSFADEKAAVRGFVYDFEKPLDKEGDTAIRQSFLKSINSAISGTGNPADEESVSTTSARSGGFFGNDQQCVSLSKHFSGLGAASSWKVKSGSITPGTVIATMAYNDGSGGKMAKDMPDGKSHYHTGIALSAPNSRGEVLILEQFAGQPARVRSININNYNGERWGVVEGGEPSSGTMKAVELGKSLANGDQLAWIQSSTGEITTQRNEKGQIVEITPTKQSGVAKPTFTTNDQAPQYSDQQQQSTSDTATVQKPDKSKKTYETYKFDPEKYYNEVNSKHPEAKFFGYDKERIMKETYDGFEKAAAAGAIEWNKKTHEIKVLNPNHQAIQEIYRDMDSQNIDRNQFLTQSEAGGGGHGRAKVNRVKKASTPRDDTYEGFLPDLRPDVGEITGQFESGKYGQEAKAKSVETISTGKHDKGGISYGRHQLASKTGTMAEFLRSDEAAPFRDAFGKLKPGTPKFNAVYQQVAKTNSDAFDKAQHEFLARTHYTPFLKTAAKLGFDVNDPRIQESVWGGGVQFRNNMRKILENAQYAANKSVEEQVRAIAKAKQERAPSIKHRYQPEAQAILGETPGGGFERANVMDMSKHEQYMHEQKKKKLAFEESRKPTVAKAPEPEKPTVAKAPEPEKPTVAKAPEPEKPTATVSAQPTTPPKSMSQKALEALGYPSGVAEERPPVQPTQPATQQQMPQLSPVPKPSPEHIRTNIAPSSDKDVEEFLMKNPVPPKNDQHSMNVPSEKPQSPVVVDSFLKQHTTGFPSPSLERAMNNTRGYSEINVNRINMGTSIA